MAVAANPVVQTSGMTVISSSNQRAISFYFITFGDCFSHLAYRSGRKVEFCI